MFDALAHGLSQTLPYRLPLEAGSLSTLTAEMESDQQLNEAIHTIDWTLLCLALRGSKECFMYSWHVLPYPKSGSDFFLGQFVEGQRKILLNFIGDQMDRSGLSALIASRIPSYFSSYSFHENDDFLDCERLLLSDFNIEKENFYRLAEIADMNKNRLFDYMSSPNFSCRAILGSDPPNWSAFGCTLAGVNVGALAAPEPIISKGLGLGSIAFGLAASLWPSG